jgi:hypothetical protein
MLDELGSITRSDEDLMFDRKRLWTSIKDRRTEFDLDARPVQVPSLPPRVCRVSTRDEDGFMLEGPCEVVCERAHQRV